MIKTLITKRLTLKKPDLETDVDNFFSYARHPEVGPNAGWLPHTSIEESKAIFLSLIESENMLGIYLSETMQLIGTVDLHSIDGNGDLEQRELGFALSYDFWGQGYMTEAVEKVLEYGFEKLKLDSIIAGYFSFNERSRRVQEKLGFVFTRIKPVNYQPFADIVFEMILTKETYWDMKKMSNLATKYNFKEVEENRYKTWIMKNYFKSGDKNKPPFSIVMPPPNITGKLHLGHAWDGTLQDIIIRRKRMQGFDVLFLPGMDHAGIATQAIVEERLRKEGLSRYDLGRKGFLEQTWLWKDEYSELIRNQWKALGLSVDFSKEKFTLDENVNDAVNHVFIELYNRGKIYRGNRIINWDPQAKTALSNIEVEYQDETIKLYYFKYPLVNEDKYLVIATTRPETMFADQALMVHPKDKRYSKMIGKQVYIPGTNTIIPVIADDYVDIDFGTGVVKVTPAHDPNDFMVGERHDLLMPLCMNEDGTMNEMAGKYQHQDRSVCRKNIVTDLQEQKLVEKIEDYQTSVGYSERTGVVVEPRLSLQWFVKMDELAEESLKTEVNFVPPRFKNTFNNWMNNIQDWCISRQLWWGHQIPAWYKDGEVKVQIECPGADWHQDEDVLDTWFSSALWPFVTLGWPTQTEDFTRFYPTSVLVTGYDIIFFWVARMIFQAQEFTLQDPFKDVLIHGLIRDKNGIKMSKSLGNGVDPVDVIEKYGVDALRYFLATNSAPGSDLRYEEEKVESSWNFINKLWNITRFITLNITNKELQINPKELTLVDKWILTKLSETIKTADYNYEKYEFGEASRALYNFIWEDFANTYVEFAKISLSETNKNNVTQSVLLYVLSSVLKMLHPFMPFVTEKLFLEISNEETIMTSIWPLATYDYSKEVEYFEEISNIISKVRNFRSENDVIPSKPLTIHITISNDTWYQIIKNEIIYLKKFLNSPQLMIEKILSNSDQTMLITTNHVSIYVVKTEVINPEKEKSLLEEQKKRLLTEISRSQTMLSNEKFLAKAPQNKITEEQEKFENYKKQYDLVASKLKIYD